MTIATTGTRLSNLIETMFKYLNMVTAHMVWDSTSLLPTLFFPGNQLIAFRGAGDHDQQQEEELRICHYTNTNYPEGAGSNEEEAIECVVCLCKIDEGEEMRELRCNHLFHRGCLDRWRVGYGRCTCPLCRDQLIPRRKITELGMEVLEFKFCSFTSRDDRDRWWLR